MNAALLNPSTARRLAKLCGMLGSNHDGERAAAAAKADALVRSLGLTWADVIAAPPLIPAASDWDEILDYCDARREQLRPREQEFISSMMAWHGEPSEKQRRWLTNIYTRLHSRGEATE